MGDSTAAALECSGLAIRRGGVDVVRLADFRIERGNAVGIVGAGGCGKTSLLLALAGFLPASAGRLEYMGKDVTSWSADKRARAGLRLASPEFSLVPRMAVADHMRLAAGLTNAHRAVVLDKHLADRLSSPAEVLSGGMQRVLALTIALSSAPGVLLVDDLAEGLQPSITEDLLTALRVAAQSGTAMVLVDRSPATLAQVCNNIYTLVGGRLQLGAS